MEELLTHIALVSNNIPVIKQAAQEAVDFLRVQDGLIRDPAYELREKCFLVLQLCLETKRNKFTALAVTGFQKILRDDRFHTNIEPDDDTKRLPLQLLQAIKCFSTLSDDTQVDILKILLNVACSKKWGMNGRTIISIVSLCSEAFESGNTAIRTAAQAASCQTLRSFCITLEEEHEEDDLDVSNFNEIIPVMQFICSKIYEAECSSHCEHGVAFLLECLLTLCSSLPQTISSNNYLKTFFWQKLCPILISVLGTPRVDKNIVTRSSGVEKERGRGSGGLKSPPSFNSIHAKTIYSINIELVRLFGSVASVRPVLESVFHRVLLYPAPEHRQDALKATTELIRNSNRLLDMAGPLIPDNDEIPVSDMSLLRLIMDSIEESSKSTFPVMQASVSCCFGLLKAIEELTLGQCVGTKIAEVICEMFPNLMDSDYTGPRIYQSMNRLPKPYRENLKKTHQNLKEENEYENTLESQGYDSESSENTEGPEEDVDDDDDDDHDDQDLEVDEDEDIAEEEMADVEKSDGLREKMPSFLGFTLIDSSVEVRISDRQNARHFVGALNDLLPQLAPMRSSIQVDQALQSFASQYCEGIISEQSGCRMARADGIYLSTYSALILDLQLLQMKISAEKKILITEEDFLKNCQCMGVTTYLSANWLRELYQLIVTSNLLETHGFFPTNHNSQPHALINLLTDVEGLRSYQYGCQMLWACRRLEKPAPTDDDNLEKEAGLRLGRRVLTCCLEGVLKVLAVPLSQRKFKSSTGKFQDLRFLRNENKHKQIKDTVSTSIEGLQIVARLCNTLGLQNRCGSIMELLTSASCIEPDEKTTRLMRLQNSDSAVVRLTPSHSLSLDLVLGLGLELGSHCSECWPHVFRCSTYVKKLEHSYFSKFENRALGSTTKVTKKEENPGTVKSGTLTLDPQLEDDNCVDVYSFLCSYESPQTVAELVATATGSSTDVLKPADTAKVICVLSQLVDRLFEDAASKLNLKSLESFSSALCTCSHKQLFFTHPKTEAFKRYWWQKYPGTMENANDALLLDSVGEIMLKCARSGRPLFHVMRIWAITGPHLMEAACHKDLTVSRKAIKHIHDIINVVLAEHAELPHFYVNETLFKPFENLLCLELCEPDIQDQIVSCICEFVEANFREIHSGWRPLFGALRAVTTNINILLVVFKVFLETENALVFSYAAVDYITCLLKHLRAQTSCTGTEVGFEVIKYLKSCETILSSMYSMPQSIAFHSAHHIQVSGGLLVDPAIPEFEIFNFNNAPEDLLIGWEESHSLLSTPALECSPMLDAIDKPSGVLKVWFLLLEGMHSAAISAKSLQSTLLEMLYSDLGKLIDNPGPIFGLLVFNRLVLPMTQSWLRQLSRVQENEFSGLKQSIGLLSDLVLVYFDRLHNNEACINLLNLLLNQVLILLSECSIHPIPAVARIGPACLRHIILIAGKTFNSEQWKCVTSELYRVCDITLAYLRQLMVPFSKDSHQYYGDSAQVKVAARRALSAQDIQDSVQLSHRVFLLDEQYLEFSINRDGNTDDQRMIYSFLVQASDEDLIRIPVKSLVIALHAHQTILQVIADMLLQGVRHRVSSLANILCTQGMGDKSDPLGFPGLMKYLKPYHISRLLSCLNYSYRTALAFDSRPGLKFLIQKVAGLEQAANLYRQTGAASAIRLMSLFEYCLVSTEQGNMTTEDIKKMLETSQMDLDSDLHFFLKTLKETFKELCKTYVDVVAHSPEGVSNKQGSKQGQLFFLMASQEDALDVGEDGSTAEDRIKPEPDKPFALSDFSKQASIDSPNGDENKENDCNEGNRDEDKREGNQVEEENNMVKGTDECNRSDDANVVMDVLNEYKKKKKFLKPYRSPPLTEKECNAPLEIEHQRRCSFLKDSEAHRRVWTEMLSSVFELLQQLTDAEFQKFLPVYIDGVRQLMAYVSEPSLKQAVSEFFQRIAVVFGFGTT